MITYSSDLEKFELFDMALLVGETSMGKWIPVDKLCRDSGDVEECFC